MYTEMAVKELDSPTTVYGLIERVRAQKLAEDEVFAQLSDTSSSCYGATVALIHDHTRERNPLCDHLRTTLWYTLPFRTGPIHVRVAAIRHPDLAQEDGAPPITIDVGDLDYVYEIHSTSTWVRSKEQAAKIEKLVGITYVPVDRPAWGRPATADDMKVLSDLLHVLQGERPHRIDPVC